MILALGQKRSAIKITAKKRGNKEFLDSVTVQDSACGKFLLEDAIIMAFIFFKLKTDSILRFQNTSPKDDSKAVSSYCVALSLSLLKTWFSTHRLPTSIDSKCCP